MKIKKNTKIILSNLAIFLTLLTVCDYFVYIFSLQDTKLFQKNPSIKIPFEYRFYGKKRTIKEEKENLSSLRNPSGLNYTNSRKIVLFGCSFVYGHGLNENQTIGYKLSNFLKIPVYNRAMVGGNPQELWYQVAAEGSEDFYNEVPLTDTYIYTIIDSHFERIYNFYPVYTYRHPLNYLTSKGELKRDIQQSLLLNLLKISYSYRFIEQKIKYNFLTNKDNYPKIINNTALYLIESKKELEKRNKQKINFIVLFYDKIRYEEELEQKLKENGIYVIKTKDLTKEDLRSLKYTLSETDKHPNEAAWDLLTPLIAKEIEKIWAQNP